MSRAIPPFRDPAVASVFDSFETDAREALLAIRALIFETAKATNGVGRLEEALRWGQPAYLTTLSRSGSTLRLGSPMSGKVALYVHCQTTLIYDFQEKFPEIEIEPKRAVYLSIDKQLPELAVVYLIRSALTYHSRKRRGSLMAAKV